MAKSAVKDVVAGAIREQGMTLREFGQALGVSHVTVGNWRGGRSQPPIDFLIRTAREFEDWRREFALDCLERRLGEDSTRAMKLRDWIWKGDGDGQSKSA